MQNTILQNNKKTYNVSFIVKFLMVLLLLPGLTLLSAALLPPNAAIAAGTSCEDINTKWDDTLQACVGADGTECAGQLHICAANFPDENFREYLQGELSDANGKLPGEDGYLSDEEIALIKKIDVDNKNTSSLAGLNFFRELTILECKGNQLTKLDVSQNTALTSLYCENNKLTELDVSQNTALIEFLCNDNLLETLDVSQNKKLTKLYCHNNQLTKLDVSHNPELAVFACDNNKLRRINVSQNTLLTDLYCNNIQLQKLNISHNPALTLLGCAENQLPRLDVSHNAELTKLQCHKNQLTALNLRNNPDLTDFSGDRQTVNLTLKGSNKSGYSTVIKLNSPTFANDAVNYNAGRKLLTSTDSNVAATDFTAATNSSNSEFELSGMLNFTYVNLSDTDLGKIINKGDLNGDGQVDQQDSACLRQAILGKIHSSAKTQMDLNGDGKVNYQDAAWLADYLEENCPAS